MESWALSPCRFCSSKWFMPLALQTQTLPLCAINTNRTNILPALSSCSAATLVVNIGFVSGCCGLVHVLEWELIKGSDAQAFSKEKMPFLATTRNNTTRTNTNFSLDFYPFMNKSRQWEYTTKADTLLLKANQQN